ncbi:DUF654-domain-containing protein [Xylona heveae TC161]|uniref:DUF654-domain-containing protein n=1 Tax=Xylona heveae (strain CBS 132557 / TC161) TaxID=1328760 RepID=A0A165J6D9_XYLHT|nr:DUF654-domain-containing protein [Xylona heveae TC161]KZF25795.1 DUF654-domain-containing protein [Xylona heveae TC161]
MSSRALRKAQKEREQQEILSKLAEPESSQAEQSEEEEEALTQSRSTSKPNIFALLNEGDRDEDDYPESVSNDDEEPPTVVAESETRKKDAPTKKKNKKKKKGKSGNASGSTRSPATPNTGRGGAAQLDEIDIALKSLSSGTGDHEMARASERMTARNKLFDLLSIDTAQLNVTNEMRRLFGRAALQSDAQDEDGQDIRRRRGRGQQELRLADALSGARGRGGRGLGSLGLRRNIFFQGKEEWPRATGGGLGMEAQKGQNDDGTVTYNFVHNTAYQDVQRQFDSCVLSMDPTRMVRLLQYNPYHISTLLQVSEIAKQDRDHALSGDLLERALFSFGRAVHSTFASNLSQGKARLDFRRPENREFWLAGWRYINNLGMRGTWRTAFEWAKLLFSLDPVGDHYCMATVIDQIALRANQPQFLLAAVEVQQYLGNWDKLPNVQISTSLAQKKLGHPQDARASLQSSVEKYPWIFARLFQELNLDRLPPSIWGRLPRTDLENLQTELYALRAKDLWNTPETITFLVEVVETTKSSESIPENHDPISLDLARHVLLTDLPPLISHLPRAYTTQATSASDPLPPADNKASYSASSVQEGSGIHVPEESHQEMRDLHHFFQRIFPWYTELNDPLIPQNLPPEEMDRAIAASGVDEVAVMQRAQRLQALRYATAYQQLLRSRSQASEVENGEFGTVGDQIAMLNHMLQSSALATHVEHGSEEVEEQEGDEQVDFEDDPEAEDEIRQEILSSELLVMVDAFHEHGTALENWTVDQRDAHDNFVELMADMATSYPHLRDFGLQTLGQQAGTEARRMVEAEVANIIHPSDSDLD